MKYVTIEDPTGRIQVATFSEDLVHEYIAIGMKASFRGKAKIRSAGFFYLPLNSQGGGVRVSDKTSESLNGLGPAPGDVTLIGLHLEGASAQDVANLQALVELEALKRATQGVSPWERGE